MARGRGIGRSCNCSTAGHGTTTPWLSRARSRCLAAELLRGQLEALPRARVTRHIPDLFAANGVVPAKQDFQPRFPTTARLQQHMIQPHGPTAESAQNEHTREVSRRKAFQSAVLQGGPRPRRATGTPPQALVTGSTATNPPKGHPGPRETIRAIQRVDYLQGWPLPASTPKPTSRRGRSPPCCPSCLQSAGQQMRLVAP